MTASDWFALEMLWMIDDIIRQLESLRTAPTIIEAEE